MTPLWPAPPRVRPPQPQLTVWLRPTFTIAPLPQGLGVAVTVQKPARPCVRA